MTFKNFYILLCCIKIINGAVNKNTAGPFDMIIKGAERCPGYEKDEFQFTYKFKKLNRTALAIDCNVTTKTPVSDADKGTVILDVKTNNNWKENYLTKDFTLVCTTMEVFVPELMARLYKILGVKRCPIKPGNYSASNFLLSWDVKTVPIFFYNEYRAWIKLYSKEGRRKFCVQAYVDIVPKRRTKG